MINAIELKEALLSQEDRADKIQDVIDNANMHVTVGEVWAIVQAVCEFAEEVCPAVIGSPAP